MTGRLQLSPVRTRDEVWRAALKGLEGYRKTRGGYEARCPVHGDKHRSLSLWWGGVKGRVLFKCHAGCDLQAIYQAAGINPADLYLERPRAPEQYGRDLRAHPYRDPDGSVVAERVKRQRGPEVSWTWRHVVGAETVYRKPEAVPPYNLPELLRRPGELVWHTEGERDADTLTDLGLLATTTHQLDPADWLDHFRGRDVVLVPDCDGPGANYLRDKAEELLPVVRTLSVAIIPNPDRVKGWDVTDWVESHPGADVCRDLEELQTPITGLDALPIWDSAVGWIMADQLVSQPAPVPDKGAFRDRWLRWVARNITIRRRDDRFLATLMALVSWASASGEEVRPGRPLLARTLNLSEETIKKHLARAARIGLITQVSPGGGRIRKGSALVGRATIYRLTIPGEENE